MLTDAFHWSEFKKKNLSSLIYICSPTLLKLIQGNCRPAIPSVLNYKFDNLTKLVWYFLSVFIPKFISVFKKSHVQSATYDLSTWK